MHVILFSDMQAGVQEKIKKAAEQNAGKADIFPAFQEKLLTEITAHEGDVFIVPEDMFQAYDDPENFQPLNDCLLKKHLLIQLLIKKQEKKRSMPFRSKKGKNS